MKSNRPLLAALLVPLILAACGQKGPLYLPRVPAAPAGATPAAAPPPAPTAPADTARPPFPAVPATSDR